MPGLIPLSNLIEITHEEDGTVNSFGWIKFYKNNVYSELQDVYIGYNSTDAIANPYQLDASGFIPDIWLDDLEYSIELLDSSSSQIWLKNNVNLKTTDTQGQVNLINGGSFENDSNADGTPDYWELTSYSGSTNLRVTDQHQDGKACMKFRTTGSGGGYLDSENFFNVSPLLPFDVLFELICDAADIRNKVDVYWYTEAEVQTAITNVYDEELINPLVWTGKGGNVTPPSDARLAKIRVTGGDSSNSNTGTVWFDNVIIRPQTPIGLIQTIGDMFYADSLRTLARIPGGSPGTSLRFGANAPEWESSTGDAGGKLYLYNHFR